MSFDLVLVSSSIYLAQEINKKEKIAKTHDSHPNVRSQQIVEDNVIFLIIKINYKELISERENEVLTALAEG